MWQNWVNVILGIWLIIAPFIFNFDVAARWNSVIVGIVVAVLAYWANSLAQSKTS